MAKKRVSKPTKKTPRAATITERSLDDFPNLVKDLGECTFRNSKIGYGMDPVDQGIVATAGINFRDTEPERYIDKYTLACWVYWELWRIKCG